MYYSFAPFYFETEAEFYAQSAAEQMDAIKESANEQAGDVYNMVVFTLSSYWDCKKSEIPTKAELEKYNGSPLAGCDVDALISIIFEVNNY